MKKQVYELDVNGYINEIYVKDYNEDGSPINVLAGNIVDTQPPDGLYRAKWTGAKWVEDMAQEEINELKKPTKEQEIALLKSQLAKTDYQIIKASEYQLVGLEAPYNLAELHTKRQVLRDKINELENL